MANSKKVAIVTGGAGGIGASCAQRLAQDGFRIGIVDIKSAEEVIQTITSAGGEAEAFTCDITQPAAVSQLVSDVEAKLGGCDVLINNAGRYDFTPTDHVSFADWRKIMDLNLDGMFLMTQGFIKNMRNKGWGRVICMVSNSCFSPPPALTAYAGSKSAVIGYIRSLSGEVGTDGVTVNAVAPGPIITEQLRRSFYGDDENPDPDAFDNFMNEFTKTQSIPRLGTPDDVAKVISFFASDESSFITGQTLVVDGGYAKH
jgi:NAD(P)-dependent dehydrogenase (short-subunit alcohol dehydrogenase family)